MHEADYPELTTAEKRMQKNMVREFNNARFDSVQNEARKDVVEGPVLSFLRYDVPSYMRDHAAPIAFTALSFLGLCALYQENKKDAAHPERAVVWDIKNPPENWKLRGDLRPFGE
jgi:hypothetical protein